MNSLSILVLSQLEISAREAGSNKQIASKSCALSLVRQLFHLNVITAFNGTLKRNPEKDLIRPFPVVVRPDIERQLNEAVRSLNLSVAIPVSPRSFL